MPPIRRPETEVIERNAWKTRSRSSSMNAVPVSVMETRTSPPTVFAESRIAPPSITIVA